MTVTLIGDFADPLSFLASQRIAQIRSLGMHDVRWLAVEADRSRPMGGRPVDETAAQTAERLLLPGEVGPMPGVLVPSSRAATAAYAESVADGVEDALRQSLFDALWLHGRNIADPDVLRSLVFAAHNPDPPAQPIEWRIRANQPIVPLGDVDMFAVGRRLGLVASLGRGPLTRIGERRRDAWLHLWLHRGAPELPLVLTDLGEAFAGEIALLWLADRLPQGEAVDRRPRQTVAAR